jgi:glycosyltransferase involved in cell wall biosynthesis
MPNVSVLISVYNGEDFISKAIDSVLVQTYKNFEILLIDDNSKDSTSDILIKYAKKFPKKIKLFRNKKNIGLTKCLIKIMKNSKGKYIARLDADDFWHKDKLKIQINFLNKNKKVVLLGSSGFKVDSNNNVISKIGLNNLNHKSLKNKLLFKNYFLHSSIIFKKNIYYKSGGYNSDFKFSQDYDLWLKISKIGNIGNLDDNLIYLSQHKNSITSKNKKIQSLYAFIISCIHKSKTNIKLKNKNLFNLIKKLKQNTDKTHFDSLCYLYSEYLPVYFSKNIFSLNFQIIKYLLKDKNFFIRKTIKKILLK